MPWKITLYAMKQELRHTIREAIRNLSEEEVNSQSDKVIQKLIRHPAYQNCHRLSLYLSTRGEVVTTKILRNAFERGKACYVPCFERGSSLMEMVRLRDMADFTSLPATLWNIKQPSDWKSRENCLTTGGLDLIVTPGVAFTKTGCRLGHGRGYYDAYIKRYVDLFKTRPSVIGLALKEQICDDLPCDELDQLMDVVLYPD